MKTQKTFSDLIGKSPLGPIQAHMEKSKDCAEELVTFIEAVIQDNWDKASLSRDKIVILEKEADVLKAETRDLLPKGLFLSVPREDLLDLIGLADEIPNTVIKYNDVKLASVEYRNYISHITKFNSARLFSVVIKLASSIHSIADEQLEVSTSFINR